MIHAGDKPYPCDICEKAFFQSIQLANHKRVHTGKKPYSCNICEKTFSSSNALAYHKRVHTGEKPYSCNICQKSFSSRSNLSYHVKTSAHLKRKEGKNIDSSSHENSFIDCGDTIKVEDIKDEIDEEGGVNDPLSYNCEEFKEEVKEEESVDDSLSVQEREISESDNICTEIKEEGIDDDPLCVQEINIFGYEENNTVGDFIDIVEHKIEIYN